VSRKSRKPSRKGSHEAVQCVACAGPGRMVSCVRPRAIVRAAVLRRSLPTNSTKESLQHHGRCATPGFSPE